MSYLGIKSSSRSRGGVNSVFYETQNMATICYIVQNRTGIFVNIDVIPCYQSIYSIKQMHSISCAFLSESQQYAIRQPPES